MPLEIQSSPKCKAQKKFRSAAYRVYVSKEFFSQRSITSHLVAVFWRLSGMASCSISWDEIWICRGILERVKGIEPSYAAWEAAVLPLNYTRVDLDFTWVVINIQFNSASTVGRVLW